MNNIQKTEHEAKWIESRCTEMIEQFKDKNVAYDHSFGKTFRSYGNISSLTRLSDKFNRIEALLLGAQNNVRDERINDTLIDMACYCLMLAYELECEASEKTNKK